MMQAVEQADRLLTDRQVGELYGVTRFTVWHWARAGRIPGPIVNRTRFARWSHLQIQESIRALREAERQEASS